MDKQIEVAGDFIAGLAEQSAQGYIMQAQDEEIKRLKGQRDQAVKALQLFVDVYKNIGKDYQIMGGILWEAEKAIDLITPPDMSDGLE